MTTRSYVDEIYNTYTSPKHRLGSIIDFPDGRRFRFALNGASALSVARLVQMPVPTTAHKNCAVAAAAAVGAVQVSVTLGAGAATADQYKDGYLFVNDAGTDTTTEGYTYRVKTHDAIDSAGTGTFTLYEDSPVKVALTTNSQVTLIANPYSGVIVHPSPPTALPVGVTVTAVGASAYCWLQTRGPAVILTDGTLVIANEAVPSGSVDGAVGPLALTEGTPNTGAGAFVVGNVIVVEADTEEAMVMLRPLD